MEQSKERQSRLVGVVGRRCCAASGSYPICSRRTRVAAVVRIVRLCSAGVSSRASSDSPLQIRRYWHVSGAPTVGLRQIADCTLFLLHNTSPNNNMSNVDTFPDDSKKQVGAAVVHPVRELLHPVSSLRSPRRIHSLQPLTALCNDSRALKQRREDSFLGVPILCCSTAQGRGTSCWRRTRSVARRSRGLIGARARTSLCTSSSTSGKLAIRSVSCVSAAFCAVFPLRRARVASEPLAHLMRYTQSSASS